MLTPNLIVMKKIFAICLMAVMTIAFASCAKEKTTVYEGGPMDGTTVNSGDVSTSLVGTNWKSTYDQTTYVIIHFTSTGSGYVESYEGYNSEEQYFSYTYSNGSGYITLSGYQPEYFSVSGNVLTIDGDSFYRI